MTRSDLAMLVGPLVTPAGRSAVGAFARGEAFCINLRYEHARDWVKMQKIIDTPGVALGDGQEWFHLWLEEVK